MTLPPLPLRKLFKRVRVWNLCLALEPQKGQQNGLDRGKRRNPNKEEPVVAGGTNNTPSIWPGSFTKLPASNTLAITFGSGMRLPLSWACFREFSAKLFKKKCRKQQGRLCYFHFSFCGTSYLYSQSLPQHPLRGSVSFLLQVCSNQRWAPS